MSRSDAAAFLVTAFGVLAMNAVLAVAVGCLVYVMKYVLAAVGSSRIGSSGLAGPVDANQSTRSWS